ncbi:AraC family transcriptional regulator [Actinosynnema sp. NPDC050801]|uniref:AraC family transcriptional regulator n=1 Tax=unclassified Actinosynnema TaxID=2637065 RepID=UPI0033F78F0A
MAAPSSVAQLHVDAVTRVVRHIRAEPGAPHPLAELAAVAMLSPSHFRRTFWEVTATTPAQFLTAVRMAVAKRLLTETDLSVTAIRDRVGYTSLGTFTTRFSRLVGVSPSAYRRAVAQVGGRRISSLLDVSRVAPFPRAAVRGVVLGGPSHPAVLVTGLFPAGIPSGRPVGCTVLPLTEPDGRRVGIAVQEDGEYQAFAVCLAERTTITRALCADPQEHVGSAEASVVVRGGRAEEPFEVRLHRARPYDPPVIPAVPLLLALGRT